MAEQMHTLAGVKDDETRVTDRTALQTCFRLEIEQVVRYSVVFHPKRVQVLLRWAAGPID